MSSIYEDLQGVAKELFAAFDQKRPGLADPASNGIYYIELTSAGGTAQNPGAPIEIPHKVDGTARPVSTKYVGNTSVLATDKQVAFAVSDAFVPVAGGFFKVDGVPYKIIRLMTVPDAGTPVAYIVIVRK